MLNRRRLGISFVLRGMDSVPSYQGLFNMPAIHFFKIKKGRTYDIDVTGLVLPYGTRTGWA